MCNITVIQLQQLSKKLSRLTNGSREMGITGSKTRLPVDQPHQNGKLIVTSPSMTSSTPSSPNRDVSLPRNRSQSFDAANTTEKTGDDVDNNVNGGSESIGFSLAELALYCNTDRQHHSDEEKEENQSPGGERICESRDYNEVTTISAAEIRGDESTAETSSPSNKAPLQVCGVKPPVVEQPAQKATDVDESAQPPSNSPARPTKSDGSSDNPQPRQRINNAMGTRTKAGPLIPEKPTRRSSEAIIDITQAKVLTHRAVESKRQKKPNLAEAQRRRRNEQKATTTTLSTNGTPVKELLKRCPSAKSGVSATKSQQSTGPGNTGKGLRTKPQSSLTKEQTHQPPKATTDSSHDTKEEQHVPVIQSEKTPDSASGSEEASTQQHNNMSIAKPATTQQDEQEPTRPEMKVVVRSKLTTDATQPTSNVNQKSSSTTSQKKVSQNANASQPAAADDNGDDDDDEDWENLITALRDPDDVRNRKSQPRKDSGWNLWCSKLLKPAKEEKPKTTKDDGEEETEVNDVSNMRDTKHHKSAISTSFMASFYRATAKHMHGSSPKI